MEKKNIFESYLKEIAGQQQLSDQEERELGRRIQQGDARAVDRLVSANLKFVIALARQYRNRGVDFEDLVAKGNMGMLKAAQKYDGEHPIRFVNFAATYIRSAMEEAIARQQGMVPKLRVDRNGEHGETAVKSIDAPIPEGSQNNISLLHVLKDPDAPQTDAQLNTDLELSHVKALLGMLPDREQDVLRLVLGIGCEKQTMEEAGHELGLKRERVRQIRDRALRRIRQYSHR